MNIGPPEILLFLVILLVLFGAKKLPEIGKGLGKGIREFKDATKGLTDDVKEGIEGKAPARPADTPSDPPKSE